VDAHYRDLRKVSKRFIMFICKKVSKCSIKQQNGHISDKTT